MENGSGWRRFALALLLIGMAVAIGAGAYHFGLEQGFASGMVQGSKALVEQPGGAGAAAAGAATAVLPPYAYAWGYGPPWHYWGHGFFFAPFFGILLLFLLLKLAFGRRHWHRGWHHRYDGVPPHFEEWHRRAHEGADKPAP